MIVLGYLTDNTEWEVTDEHLGSLTHINYAFATVADLKGTVVENWKKADKLTILKENFPHLKICISIGGWGAGNFSESVETEEGRKNFSKTSIDIMKKYGLDGIDLDWEYPCMPGGNISFHPDDKRNFTLLLQQIRDDLNRLSKETDKSYLLTIAAGASERYIHSVELDQLNHILDFINVMTYDMGGSYGITGHHTNIYPSEITQQKGGAYFIERFIEAGVSPNKLVYGVAFYGRGADKVENRDNGLCRRIHGTNGMYFDYHDIVNKINEDGFESFFDEKAKASWAFDGNIFITYECPKSIEEKMKYVKSKGLLGVIFWEYNTDQTRELLKTINKLK